MGRAPSLCGVILAAGASTRMGRDKALLPWPPNSTRPGETFLSACIGSLASETEIVFVVAGANTSQIAPVVYAQGATLVENPNPERGQFSSLRLGLQEVLSHGRDAAVVTLVDRPPVKQATLRQLLEDFEKTIEERKWAVIPEFHGKHGHPILVSREMIEVFLRAPSESNAREVEHAHQKFIDYIRVEDPTVIMNVDTPDDYAALSA